MHYIALVLARPKKTRAERELEPARNPARRALSHVGGRIQLRGRPEFGEALKRALAVSASEDQTRADIHGFHSYPARLHPSTARALIEELSAPRAVVFDPFCGSGTVLVEARAAGRTAIGRDLNPLAVALAKLKSRAPSDRERASWLAAANEVAESAEERRQGRAAPSRLYPAEDLELFEIHVLLELDGLKKAILELPSAATRRALLLVLSSILTKVSRRHGDSSRKRSERRLPAGYTIAMFGRRLNELNRQLAAFAARIPPGTPPPDVRRDDARLLHSVADRSVDLLVTSPPYAGVYDYHDHHAARLRWLGMDARTFAKSEMGSRRQLNPMSGTAASERWQHDFDRVLGAVARKLAPAGRACFVVGDSAVSGTVIRADDVATKSAAAAGLTLSAVASQKRPQFHFSSSKAFAGAPRREHVLVFERA